MDGTCTCTCRRRTVGKYPKVKTDSKLVFPQAPSPIITSFLRIVCQRIVPSEASHHVCRTSSSLAGPLEPCWMLSRPAEWDADSREKSFSPMASGASGLRERVDASFGPGGYGYGDTRQGKA